MGNLESDYTAAFIARLCDGDRRLVVAEDARKVFAKYAVQPHSFADEIDGLTLCVSAYTRLKETDEHPTH